jgi:hypothetical protein
MNDVHTEKFTCLCCGGHRLIVTHVWTIQVGASRETWQEWGPLDERHHWHNDSKGSAEEENIEDDPQSGSVGDSAEDDPAEEYKEYEIHQTETCWESDEFFVNCANCDREVEFGWSKPDRRGLIMPVEFVDFVPAINWPDPKYVNVWQQRGWLQTIDFSG